MLRKIGGGLMVAVALFFLVVIVKGIVTLPGTQRQLSEAVFITDGVVRPENEGRLVIVCSTLSAAENARDELLSLEMPSPIAVRYVESFSVGDDGENWVGSWDPIDWQSGEWLKRAHLFGRAAMGEFSVSEELLVSFPAGRELSLSQLDPDEVDALTQVVDALVYDGVLYFTEAPASCFGSGPVSEVYFDYEGLRRVHYRYLDVKPDDVYAVAGIQRGNELVADPDLDTNPVFENVHSRSDVVRQNGLFTILGMALVGVICLALIVFGIRRVMD